MLTERTLWLGATSVAVAILLLLILKMPDQRPGRAMPRFALPDIPVHSIVEPDDRRRYVSLTGGEGFVQCRPLTNPNA